MIKLEVLIPLIGLDAPLTHFKSYIYFSSTIGAYSAPPTFPNQKYAPPRLPEKNVPKPTVVKPKPKKPQTFRPKSAPAEFQYNKLFTANRFEK